MKKGCLFYPLLAGESTGQINNFYCFDEKEKRIVIKRSKVRKLDSTTTAIRMRTGMGPGGFHSRTRSFRGQMKADTES